MTSRSHDVFFHFLFTKSSRHIDPSGALKFKISVAATCLMHKTKFVSHLLKRYCPRQLADIMFLYPRRSRRYLDKSRKNNFLTFLSF